MLKGLTLTANPGQVVALLGANGAGKTTLLEAVSGLLPLENNSIDAGRIRFNEQIINKAPPHELARAGLVHVHKGRRIFAEMLVEDNLIAASHALVGRQKRPDYETVFDFFPQLKARARQTAGLLSGGE